MGHDASWCVPFFYRRSSGHARAVSFFYRRSSYFYLAFLELGPEAVLFFYRRSFCDIACFFAPQTIPSVAQQPPLATPCIHRRENEHALGTRYVQKVDLSRLIYRRFHPTRVWGTRGGRCATGGISPHKLPALRAGCSCSFCDGRCFPWMHRDPGQREVRICCLEFREHMAAVAVNRPEFAHSTGSDL